MTAPEPSTGLIIGTFLLGLLASLFWPLTQFLITMAHEGSHAFAGSVTGGRVHSIRVFRNATGETGTIGANRFLTAIMGYAGPSMFGIVGATVLANHVDPDLVLWITLVLFGVTFLQIRNVFGWIAVATAGFFFFMVLRYGSAGGRTVLSYTWTWFLLLGGFFQTAQDNVRNVGWSGDGHALRELTRLPKGFWALLWWLATLGALVYGGGILFGAIDPPLGGG